MNVLLIGGGAREHALAWRISRSPLLTRLWVAPGNFGTGTIAENLSIGIGVDEQVSAARDVSADLVVVGPEGPLAEGLADALHSFGVPVFGPTAGAARLESSKIFARELLQEANVPGPEFAAFSSEAQAVEYLRRNPGPRVVKADGLAAGKGVAVCQDAASAAEAVRACLSGGAFGAAGHAVVLEEMLEGREVSVFAFCDGETLSPLVAACDYKRVGDSDTGPNTGGMGAYSTPEFWSQCLADDIQARVMRPVVNAMSARGIPYTGVLYAGLMLTSDGPKVLEFNCRLGDPETQVILPKLETDPLEAMLACAHGCLTMSMVSWSERAHVGVVMASEGYPAEFVTGFPINGLDGLDSDDTLVFCGGVASGPNGQPITAGGRVLTISSDGVDLAQARQRVYERIDSIDFQGAFWRTDIAGVPAGEAA